MSDSTTALSLTMLRRWRGFQSNPWCYGWYSSINEDPALNKIPPSALAHGVVVSSNTWKDDELWAVWSSAASDWVWHLLECTWVLSLKVKYHIVHACSFQDSTYNSGVFPLGRHSNIDRIKYWSSEQVGSGDYSSVVYCHMRSDSPS